MNEQETLVFVNVNKEDGKIFATISELKRDGWVIDWQNSQFREAYMVFRFVRPLDVT